MGNTAAVGIPQLLTDCPVFEKRADVSVNCSDCQHVICCHELKNSTGCFRCDHLTHCHRMVRCSNCVNCSGLVNAVGVRDVHLDGQGADMRFEDSVMNVVEMDPEFSFEEKREVQKWIKEHRDSRPSAPALERPALPSRGEVRVAMIIKGSRGDAQPAVALALALQKAGFCIKLLVNKEAAPFTQSFPLEVATYPWAWGEAEGPAGFFPQHTDGREQSCIYEAMRDFKPHLLLYHKRSFLEAWVLEERLGIPTVQFCFDLDIGQAGEMHRVLGRKRLFDPVLGAESLPHWTWQDLLGRLGPKRPVLVAISETLVPRPKEFIAPTVSTGVHFTGFWSLDPGLEVGNRFFDAGPQLEEFLATGEAPVCMGWGFMSNFVERRTTALLAVEALKLTGQRGVVVGSGDAKGLPPELKAFADANVLFLQFAPHMQLLPRCCAVVHHGGCGHVAAALRAGLPMVITAVGGDQHLWGLCVGARSVGVMTADPKTLAAKDLAAALESCKAMAPAAQELGEKLREEDGVARTVEWLSSYMEEEGILRPAE